MSPAPRFPLFLCGAAIAASCLGLLAATLGIRWGEGGAVAHADALELSWLYVNVMVMTAWWLLWPAAALFPRPADAPARSLPWDAAAILTGSIPAIAVASILSACTLPMICHMIALQFSAGLFVLGMLQITAHRPRRSALAAAILATLLAAGPVVAYLWAEYMPHASQSWFLAIPLIAIENAARPNPNTPALTWITALYALTGLTLFYLGKNKPAPSPISQLTN